MKINPNIFKAYDIRGRYPEGINEEAVELIGRALVALAKTEKIVVGRDMRLSSPTLAKALIKGIIDSGCDVIDIGLVSVDVLYFASGKMNLPGAMVTASHLGKEYNGLKLCRSGAEPINQETGLKEIEKLATENNFPPVEKKGRAIERDILEEYRRHILGFVDKESIRDLRVVVDAANGMAGKIIPLLFKDLPCQIIPLYFDLDGSFPNHPSNPVEPANLFDLQKKAALEKADLGVAFDGDADRVFFIDEKGGLIESSLIIALLAREILRKQPGEKVVYSLICGRIASETIEKNKGQAVVSRVGHSFVKRKMREADAIFGGERSGHYYFRGNFYADSGFIAALKVLEIISKENKPFSQLLAPFDKYYKIEQTDFIVSDSESVLKKLEAKYRDGKISRLDGLSVEYPDWWFVLRSSNTEPVMRLNLEAKSKELMEKKTEEIKRAIE